VAKHKFVWFFPANQVTPLVKNRNLLYWWKDNPKDTNALLNISTIYFPQTMWANVFSQLTSQGLAQKKYFATNYHF
jgi:hypothetical protein